MRGEHWKTLRGYLPVLAVVTACVTIGSCSSSNGDSGSGNQAAMCGNNQLDPGEPCDGTIAPNCMQALHNSNATGFVACVSCELDTSGCQIPQVATGGFPATGAAGGTGGMIGAAATSGMGVSTGGSLSSGGFGGSGGFQSTGGLSSSGGSLSSGGFTASGGTLGSGGSGAGGGTSGSGGTLNTGGGGTIETGGQSALGDIDALRQACVDTINMYRAMLNLQPYTEATVSVEQCSDTGAQSDATAGVAHGSAGKCPGMGSQDTCPGWPPQQYGGVENALKQCLAQMWAEGLPSEGRAQCEQEYFMGNTACFEAHGHYLNMSDPTNTVASCGFYVMPNGNVWMNQDFGN